jgi:hypothetical protein
MRKMTKVLAATGGALMVLGTAAPAMAQDGDRGRNRDSRPGECSVSLDTNRRGTELTIDVDASRRADNATVRTDFNTWRNRGDNRGDSWDRISLDRRGDGSLTVDVPRRADEVTVTVYVRESGRRGGFVTCTDTLDLGRRNLRAV